MKKVYFAHPVSSYGTLEERWVLDKLRHSSYLGEIVNPAAPEHQGEVVRIGRLTPDRAEANKMAMAYFLDLAAACTACVYLPFPDGMIGAGIVAEVERFLARKARVFEVQIDDGNVFWLAATEALDEKRRLGVEETHAYLRTLSPDYARRNPGRMVTMRPSFNRLVL